MLGKMDVWFEVVVAFPVFTSIIPIEPSGLTKIISVLVTEFPSGELILTSFDTSYP